MIRLLFVCLGNICRSPTAQAVAERQLREKGWDKLVFADSAGSHAYHVGEPPDRRTQFAARKRGMDMSPQRARRVTRADLDEFDYVIAMDENNLADLHELAGGTHEHKVFLMMGFAPDAGVREVPDPYYGGSDGFETVIDLLERAVAGLLQHIEHRHPELQAGD